VLVVVPASDDRPDNEAPPSRSCTTSRAHHGEPPPGLSWTHRADRHVSSRSVADLGAPVLVNDRGVATWTRRGSRSGTTPCRRPSPPGVPPSRRARSAV